MLIRSKIHRPNAPITLDRETYFFRPVDGTPDGPHVCEVSDPTHVARLLSITEGYEAFDVPELARVQTQATVTPVAAPVAPPDSPVAAPASEHHDRVIALRALKVADLRAQLQQITDTSLLSALSAAEESATQPPPRRTVVEAIRQRISALSA